MWIVTTYAPVSLISLKMATATSTGGKSLLLPTPFAFKMALLDVLIQNEGVGRARSLWPAIRDGQMAMQGPAYIAVNNTFTKILKPKKAKPSLDPATGLRPPLIRTIGFREYVQWQGTAQIAFSPRSDLQEAWGHRLTQINYIGKRGGFIQAVRAPTEHEELPDGFALLTRENGDYFPLEGTLQIMDDCGPNLTFEQANVYTGKTIRLGKDRLLRTVILPYRLERSSRGYTLYRRLETGDRR